jgi:hypothetical protein
MTDPRKRRFSTYFRALADLMSLRDWTVGVEDAPPDPDHLAEVDCRYGRRIAWFRLSEAYLDSAPERQRQTAAHELMHLHFEPMRRLLLGLLDDTIWKAVDLPFEYGIDAAAEAIAAHLPLPDQVQPARSKPPMAKKPKVPPAPAAAPPTPAGKARGPHVEKIAKAKKAAGRRVGKKPC